MISDNQKAKPRTARYKRKVPNLYEAAKFVFKLTAIIGSAVLVIMVLGFVIGSWSWL